MALKPQIRCMSDSELHSIRTEIPFKLLAATQVLDLRCRAGFLVHS
jgi:hypothetical protein